MLRTPSGLKAIEDFASGDEILSQDEHDPRSGIVVRQVEEVFRRYAPVLGVHLRREGEESPLVIRSTSEHPFYVADPVYLGRWVAAGDLVAGMWVLCDDGRWARVEEVHDAGEWEVVYNMRVADSHTYFVGEEGRGYAVWVHNAYEEFITEVQKLKPRIAENTIRKAYDEAMDGTKIAPKTANKLLKWLDKKGIQGADADRCVKAAFQKSNGQEVSLLTAPPTYAVYKKSATDRIPKQIDGIHCGPAVASQLLSELARLTVSQQQFATQAGTNPEAGGTSVAAMVNGMNHFDPGRWDARGFALTEAGLREALTHGPIIVEVNMATAEVTGGMMHWIIVDGLDGGVVSVRDPFNPASAVHGLIGELWFEHFREIWTQRTIVRLPATGGQP